MKEKDIIKQTMQTPKILYIHGYGSGENGSTATELQRALDEKAEVIAPGFSNDLGKFENMLQNIKQATELVKTHYINLIVSSSMGAFTALNVPNCAKILINPCMLPSEQLPKRIIPDISENELAKYRELENRKITDNEKMQTFALFATNDELFSYKALFENLYFSKNSFTMEDNHKISVENIRQMLAPMVERVL